MVNGVKNWYLTGTRSPHIGGDDMQDRTGENR
jgi:hypothetical protein